MAEPSIEATLARTPARHRFRSEIIQRDWEYVRRLLITLVVLGLAYFFWRISGVLLLLFAAALLAVLLRWLADLIARYTPIPERWAVGVASLALGALLVAFSVMFGSQIGGQITQVFEKLPNAIDAAGNRIGINGASAEIEEAISSGTGQSVLSRAASIGYTVVGALVDLALVVVAAIYLAADPRLYRRGAAKLLPPSQHERIFDAMDVTGNALRLWFAGQLVSMAVVGVASGLAYWWIGLPAPLALGIIAGVMDFVPFVGPILGAIPALLFALALDLKTVFWTIGVVVVIQQLEGNVVTPLVQKHAVSMPPVLVLFAIVAFGFLFGLLGMFLAVPLAVVITVLIKKLWVRQTLGEKTEVPGEELPRDAP